MKIPHQTGWLLLASAGIVAASGLLLAWCRRVRRREAGSARRPERFRTALAWVLGFGLAGLGWRCANRDYLRPKTLLLEKDRWTIEPHIYEAGGIAYLNGKVYITEYGQPQPNGIPPLPGRVGVFDVASKTFSVIQPFSSMGSENWVHPGDVKVGPDGWLWVLNNGIGDVSTTTQMVSIDRKGRTVQLSRLGEGKPGVGWLSGLAYGPERTLYAMDGSLLIEFEVRH